MGKDGIWLVSTMTKSEYFIPEEETKEVIHKINIRTDKVKWHVCGKDVLDIGCGSGYSTKEYAKLSKSVIGIDINQSAINYAKEHYPELNVRLMDMRTIKFDREFDVAVATEVLEHVSKDDGVRTLEKVCEALRLDGMFIGSVPTEDDTSVSPHHTAFYTKEDLRTLLGRFFLNFAIGKLDYYSPSWFFRCKGVKNHG